MLLQNQSFHNIFAETLDLHYPKENMKKAKVSILYNTVCICRV